MTHVLHLVAHDVRTHRRLLLAWLALVVAHPVVSLLPWPLLPAEGIAAPFFLIVSRLLLAAVALATIVQADNALDDRTFWRTRAIPARTMAAAKLAIGVIFVAVPLMVVLLVALIVRVPISHLPSTIAQVVITDASAVGFVLLLASRTGSVASMLIALLCTLVASFGLLRAISRTVRMAWVRQFYVEIPPSTDLALPTMLLVVVLAAWTMTAMGFLGRRYRLPLVGVGALAVLALAIIWVVPAVRLHQATPRFHRDPTLSVDASQIRAERLETGRIALLTTGTLSGLQPGDRSRQYLIDGTFEGDGGPVAARQPADLQFVAGRPGAHPVLLGVISEADLRRLAGKSVRFQGRINIEVARTEIIGTLPLVAGVWVDVGRMRIRIRELRPPFQPRWLPGLRPPSVQLATVDATWTAQWAQEPPMTATRWWLRNGAIRQSVFQFMRTPFEGLELLPSLARPFGHERGELYVSHDASTATDAASSIEIEVNRGTVLAARPLQVDFVMPTTATAVWERGGDGRLGQPALPTAQWAPRGGRPTPTARTR